MITIPTSPADLADDERAAFVCTAPSFMEFWFDLESQVTSIVNLVRPSITLREAFVVEPLKRFAQMCFLAPASASYHHDGVTGLVRHSFAVALKILSDPAIDHLQFENRLCYLMVALLHDIGKLWDLRISSPQAPQAWMPHVYNMDEWVSSNRVVDVRIAWKKPRQGTIAHRTSEAIGLTYLSCIFPSAVMTLCGRRRINAVIWALTRENGTVRYDYYTRFKQADIASVLDDRQTPTASQVVLARLADTILSRRSEIRPNMAGTQVFIGPSHTLISVPGEGERSLIWDTIREMARSETLNLRRRAPLDCLTHVLGNAVVPCPCPTDRGGPGGSLFEVRLGVGNLKALAIRNESLWQSFAVEGVIGDRPPALTLGVPGRPSMTIDQLGFAGKPHDPVTPAASGHSCSLDQGASGAQVVALPPAAAPQARPTSVLPPAAEADRTADIPSGGAGEVLSADDFKRILSLLHDRIPGSPSLKSSLIQLTPQAGTKPIPASQWMVVYHLLRKATMAQRTPGNPPFPPSSGGNASSVARF